MTRALTAVALPVALLALLPLAGCGGDDDRATDPTPADRPTTTPATTPTGSATSTPSPSGAPTEAPYPGFEPTDYTYVVAVSCFCPDAGTPVRVTVVADEVTEAVLAANGVGRGGGRKGDPAPDYLRITIDDIIDRVNAAVAAGAAQVDVEWPAGQDHPVRVYIDEDERMADEEIGYQLSGVTVT